MNRRSFLQLMGIAPVVITTPGLLMKVKPLSTLVAAIDPATASAKVVFLELIIPRLDMEGVMWQIYQTMRVPRTMYDYSELVQMRPTKEQMDRFTQMADLAFKRALRRDNK